MTYKTTIANSQHIGRADLCLKLYDSIDGAKYYVYLCIYTVPTSKFMGGVTDGVESDSVTYLENFKVEYIDRNR